MRGVDGKKPFCFQRCNQQWNSNQGIFVATMHFIHYKRDRRRHTTNDCWIIVHSYTRTVLLTICPTMRTFVSAPGCPTFHPTCTLPLSTPIHHKKTSPVALTKTGNSHRLPRAFPSKSRVVASPLPYPAPVSPSPSPLPWRFLGRPRRTPPCFR